MDIEPVKTVGLTITGGFFGGILIGYALKKVVKIVAVVVGLFFAGLTYLQYQEIIDMNELLTSTLALDACPCFLCPIENECLELKHHNTCSYLEQWAFFGIEKAKAGIVEKVKKIKVKAKKKVKIKPKVKVKVSKDKNKHKYRNKK